MTEYCPGEPDSHTWPDEPDPFANQRDPADWEDDDEPEEQMCHECDGDGFDCLGNECPWCGGEGYF